jgi:hypothetical protein
MFVTINFLKPSKLSLQQLSFQILNAKIEFLRVIKVKAHAVERYTWIS